MIRGRQLPNGGPFLQVGFAGLRWREDEVDANRFLGKALAQTGVDRPRDESASGNRGAADRSGELLDAPGLEYAAPQAAMTIAGFVENVFVPEHVALKGLSGRTHYQAILKHVLTPKEVNRVFKVDPAKSKARLKAVPNWPYLGNLRLCDVRPDDVQQLVAAALARGYSTQTVKHIRNVVSAIFAHARKKGCFAGDNPASLVTLPEMTRKEARSLTLAQAKDVLAAMQYPEKEMTLFAIFTNMTIAEICGLQWRWVNFTDTWSVTEGQRIPPRTIAVKKEWYCGELSTPLKGRHRSLPIPEPLLPVLIGLSRRANFTGPDDFVLVSRAGTPIREGNIAKRRLKLIGRDLKMPWLSWHVFRRTHTTLAFELGMQLLDDSLPGPQNREAAASAVASGGGDGIRS